MRVIVKLHGTLRRHHPEQKRHHAFEVELEHGDAVSDLVVALNLPEDMVWATSVNAEAAELDQALSGGDRVSFFPAVAGGVGE